MVSDSIAIYEENLEGSWMERKVDLAVTPGSQMVRDELSGEEAFELKEGETVFRVLVKGHLKQREQ